MDKIGVTNGAVDPDHYGPIGDAARGIASYCDDPQRVHVYTAAFDAIKDILTTRTDATPVAEAWAGMEAAMQDPDYAWGWHCNLAMPIMNATGITHEQANMAAAHLMQHLWKCDITTHPHYQYEKSGAQSYAEFRIEADKAEDAALPYATHPPATDVAALVENGCEMPEVAAMRYIEELRSDLAASVTILCDNEEAWTKDEQMAVEVIAEWTDWLAKRFMGESVIQCLARAIGARRQALAPFTKGQNDE